MDSQQSDDKQKIVQQCLVYTKEQIENSYKDNSFFHNWEHTLNVFNVVKEIGENTEGVSEDEVFILQVAALFHDLTACVETKDHEAKSATLACDFLEEIGVPKKERIVIHQLILATRLEYQPVSVLEKIIKDADLSHLRDDTYLQKPFLNLFKEIHKRKNITAMDWVKECILFFDEKKFYTEYAKQNFEAGKNKNREKLVVLSKMELKSMDDLEKAVAPPEKGSKKKKKKKSNKANKGKSTRGIETMFRTELRNHLTLSRIADDKANTLISVNAIIISIVLSTLFPKLDNNPYLTFPTLTLLVFSILTIVISIVSTLPRTTHGTLSRVDVLNRKGNLVFFGNFHKMDIEDFEWGINELMKDEDFLYDTLTRDLYFLGKVLNKKYTYLRFGYLIFVSGLIISSIVFVFALYYNFGLFGV